MIVHGQNIDVYRFYAEETSKGTVTIKFLTTTELENDEFPDHDPIIFGLNMVAIQFKESISICQISQAGNLIPILSYPASMPLSNAFWNPGFLVLSYSSYGEILLDFRFQSRYEFTFLVMDKSNQKVIKTDNVKFQSVVSEWVNIEESKCVLLDSSSSVRIFGILENSQKERKPHSSATIIAKFVKATNYLQLLRPSFGLHFALFPDDDFDEFDTESEEDAQDSEDEKETIGRYLLVKEAFFEKENEWKFVDMTLDDIIPLLETLAENARFFRKRKLETSESDEAEDGENEDEDEGEKESKEVEEEDS